MKKTRYPFSGCFMFRYDELVKDFAALHGFVPAVEPWETNLPTSLTDAISNTELKDKALATLAYIDECNRYCAYMETPKYYIFFLGARTLVYNKAGGAKPAGAFNWSEFETHAIQTTREERLGELHLDALDDVIGDISVAVVSLSHLVSEYMKKTGFIVYANGSRGIRYVDGTLYAVSTSMVVHKHPRLKTCFRYRNQDLLSSALARVLDEHADGDVIPYSSVDAMYATVKQELDIIKYGPPVPETPILMLDKNIDIFPDGFFVRVNLVDDPHDKLLGWLRNGGRKEVLSYITASFYPKFLRRIGSLDFYKPVEMTLLRAKQVQVEYRVKVSA